MNGFKVFPITFQGGISDLWVELVLFIKGQVNSILLSAWVFTWFFSSCNWAAVQLQYCFSYCANTCINTFLMPVLSALQWLEFGSEGLCMNFYFSFRAVWAQVIKVTWHHSEQLECWERFWLACWYSSRRIWSTWEIFLCNWQVLRDSVKSFQSSRRISRVLQGSQQVAVP